MAIELEGREGLPYHEYFTTGVISSGERDFHLPDTAVEVKITDAVTGEGIPGAKVRVKNNFRAKDKNGQLVPPRTPGGEPPMNSNSQSLAADDKGVAHVYYLLAGSVEISALADGYLDSEAPQKLTLAENEHRRLELKLQSVGRQATLQILLPDGRPAGGATALLLAGLDPIEVLAKGVAGPDGKVKLPEAMAGALLMVVHPQTAFAFGRWQPREAPDEAKIELPPAAEKPLTVRAKAHGEILPYAEILLFVGGQRLGPHQIFQLTSARPLTDQDGLFTVGSLPRAGVKILVFSRADDAKADAVRRGKYDAQAVEIPYPWPPLVEVEGID